MQGEIRNSQAASLVLIMTRQNRTGIYEDDARNREIFHQQARMRSRSEQRIHTLQGENDLSRRGFLRGIVGVGAGLTSAWAVPASGQPPAAPMPDSRANQSGAQNAPGSASAGPLPVKRSAARVYVNQVGYLPQEAKRAVIPADGPVAGSAFCLVADDVIPEVHYRGALTEYSDTKPQDGYAHYFFADFSDFTRPGRYRVRLSDGALSYPFTIGKDLYGRLLPLILRYFDMQRCGDQRTEQRKPCHHDDGIAVGGPRDGQVIDSSGGWHDAGDYLKFVETTSFSTALMLFAYAHFPQVFAEQTRNTRLPLLLDHARVGLDWLLKMHPTPDEFYYQVGDASDHESWRLPEDDDPARNPNWKPRKVFYGVGANLAGRCAAAFAMASRLYRRYDAPFAARCLRAAQSVYRLGLQNQKILSTTPDDFYPEKTWEDDMEWGAAALYEATRRREYLDQALQFARAAGASQDAFSVYDTHALAHYALYPHAGEAYKGRLRAYLEEEAEQVRRRAANPFGLGTTYRWGTGEAAAGAALSCLLHAALTQEEKSLAVARQQRDFILGCNPFDLCCVIGAGTRYPQFPHHPIANIANIELSGALIGGPASVRSLRKMQTDLTDVEFSVHPAHPGDLTGLPDEAGYYYDSAENYVTNEPANDYTAKFLLLTAFYAVPA